MGVYVATLFDKDIELGARITNALIEAGIPVVASLWLYDPEASDWQLVVGTPQVDKKGARATYGAVQTVLGNMQPPVELPLWKISVRSPKEPLIKSLRKVMKMSAPVTIGGLTTGRRLTQSAVNHEFIEDAYIYLLR